VHLSSGELPAALRHLVSHDEHDHGNGSGSNGHGSKYSLRVNDYAEVEPILARLRESGAVIDEMQLQQADLEDIFLQIMDKGAV
jgi:ABC-2 type transport system ATP-binding protein